MDAKRKSFELGTLNNAVGSRSRNIICGDINKGASPSGIQHFWNPHTVVISGRGPWIFTVCHGNENQFVSI